MIPSAPLGTDAAEDRSGLRAAAGVRPGAAAARRFRFELAAHPGSAAQARHLTRARLSGWAVSDDTCDTAVLVVSELVTNAIVHSASARVVCELHDRDDLVRIAVRDEGCAPDEAAPLAAAPRGGTRQGAAARRGRVPVLGRPGHRAGAAGLGGSPAPRRPTPRVPRRPAPTSDGARGSHRPTAGAPGRKGPGEPKHPRPGKVPGDLKRPRRRKPPAGGGILAEGILLG